MYLMLLSLAPKGRNGRREGEREGKKEVEKEGLAFEEKAEKQLFSILGYHKIEVKEQIPWAVEKNT